MGSHQAPKLSSATQGSSRRGFIWQGAAVVVGGGMRWAGVAAAAPAVSGKPAAASGKAVLHDWIERNHTRSPSYREGLSNHLSMSLLSLSALGGMLARLRAVAQYQWSDLEPFPSGGPAVTGETWQQQRGNGAALPALRAYFRAAIAKRGARAVLRESLPALLPGIGAAAFHCVIRTGYGVRFGDDGEVADGLAYWAAAYGTLGDLPTAGIVSEPRQALTMVRSSKLPGAFGSVKGTIFQQMQAAAALPGFAALTAVYGPAKEDALGRMADTAARFYGASLLVDKGDFTALHGVTGTHALGLLAPYLDDQAGALRYLWQALAAAYITAGAPDLAAVPNPTGAPSWDAIVGKAAQSLDAHDLKLVDIAQQEDGRYHNPLYRAVAARRIKLIRS